VLHAQASGDAGVVEFEARYKLDGKAHTLHEISRFTRHDSASPWRYIDGQVSEG
jgi:SEC-C motif domain protein